MSATTDIALLGAAGVGLFLIMQKVGLTEGAEEAVQERIVEVVKGSTNTQWEQGQTPAQRNTYNLYTAGTFTAADAAASGSIANELIKAKRTTAYAAKAVQNRAKTTNKNSVVDTVRAIYEVGKNDPFRSISDSAMKYTSPKTGKTYQLSDA